MPDNDAPVTPSGADDNVTVTDEPANVPDEPANVPDEPANVPDESETVTPSGDAPDDNTPVTPPDADALALVSLKADLNRTGNFPSDDAYLLSLIAASRQWLDAQGIHDDGSALYAQILVSNTAWIYRKRVTGESQPNFLRRMSHDFKLSGAGREVI